MATTDTGHRSAAADDHDLVDSLVQTSFVTMAVLNRVAAAHDLSLTQLRVIGILRDRRLSMTALVGYLGLDKSTMTGLVDRAEKRGLLERARHPTDGRAVDVFLAPDGVDLAERVHQEVALALAALTDTLTLPDQRRLQLLLVDMLDRHEPQRDV